VTRLFFRRDAHVAKRAERAHLRDAAWRFQIPYSATPW
jgi:hypothetical protein